MILSAATGLFAVHASVAHAQLSRLTDGVGCGSFAPSQSGNGTLTAFESDCDPVGSNADGNREIFSVDAAGAVTQLTDTTACVNSGPSSNLLGDRVAFESNCDPFATNADGNFEIFQHRVGSGVVQMTQSVSCNNFAASSNDDGTRVFYDSTCDYTGANSDLSNEIFRVDDQGLFVQFTNDSTQSFCGSYFPSSNGSGRRAAFESDCDLTGDNPDQLIEIYRGFDNGPVVRMTFGDDNCASSAPVLSGTGLNVAFQSDCDLTGGNSDGSLEVFLVDSSGTVTQVTDDSGTSACESGEPAINGDGTVVAFSSYCDPLAANGDQSIEVFRTFIGATTTQLTSGASCAALAPSIDDTGGRIVFDATCDIDGGNSDASSEIYGEPACVCGAPVTRGAANGGLPTASDALFVLQAAVGQMACDLCSCDANGSGTLTSSDALLVLQAAVGQGADLACS